MPESNPRRLRRYAKNMRSDPTVGERLLWGEVRAHRLGVKFKRQVPIGPFIPDFVCHSHRLIVEVDGESHEDLEKDRRRDRWFFDHGWFVLRFWDTEVFNDIESVVETILQALEDPSQVINPLNLHDHE